MAKVFGSGYNPKSPVYFATTVSPDNTVDCEPYLRLEGLVRRVVGERNLSSDEEMVDTLRTRVLLTEKFKLKSMLDPKVEKDENTRGLFTTYAHSHLLLANAYARAGDYQAAHQALLPALRFELEPTQKMLLFYHLSRFAALNQQYEVALAAIDSAQSYAGNEPRLRLELFLQRGFINQAMGNYPEAEMMYQQALAMAPNEWQLVQLLYRFYVEDMHSVDKARALLSDWLRRHPSDFNAQQLLRQLP